MAAPRAVFGQGTSPFAEPASLGTRGLALNSPTVKITNGPDETRPGPPPPARQIHTAHPRGNDRGMDTMAENDNIAAVHHWIALHNEEDLTAYGQTYTEDCEAGFAGGEPFHGRDAVKAMESQLRQLLPGKAARLVSVIADGDHVSVQAVLHGTLPDSGPYEIHWCSIIHFKDGQIAWERVYLDSAQLPVTLSA